MLKTMFWSITFGQYTGKNELVVAAHAIPANPKNDDNTGSTGSMYRNALIVRYVLNTHPDMNMFQASLRLN